MMPMFAPSIDSSSMVELPKAVFAGKVVVVDQIGQVPEAIACLAQSDLLGFDTETRPSFSKGQQYNMSLLQLSNEEHAYLFRLNSIGLPMELSGLLEDENIIKVGAAIHGDLRGLLRIRSIKPAGFVDLQPMAKACGINDISVRKMAAIVLQVRISKVQQLSNWDSPELTSAQQCYAATDAWVCRELYKSLTLAEPEKCSKFVKRTER